MRKAFSTSVFLTRGEEFLLVNHKRLKLWLPVGGEIEGNETPLQASMREVFEETGMELTIDNFMGLQFIGMPGATPGLIGFEEHNAGGKGWHMNFVFWAEAPTRKVVLCEEHSEYRWWKYEELSPILNKLTPSVMWTIRKILLEKKELL